MTKTLAEIVMDEGLADRATLDRAAQFADANDEPLVVGLVRHGGVDEVALTAALRRQMRVTVAEAGSLAADSDAVRQLARGVAWRRRVAPVRVDHGPANAVLEVAMADPSDAVAIAEIEHRTGCRVDPRVMVLSGVEELIEASYRDFVTQVMKRGAQAASRPRQPPRERPQPAPGPETKTAPFHRVTDEADPRLMVRTLVAMLEERGLVSEDEFEQRVLDVMKRRLSDDAE